MPDIARLARTLDDAAANAKATRQLSDKETLTESEGYDVQAVADASGSGTKMADEIAIARMRHEDVVVTSTIQVMSELVFNRAEGSGPKILPVLQEIYADLAA